MMVEQDIQELVDSWINGNKSHVLEVIESFTKTGAMALVARMCQALDEYGESPQGGFELDYFVRAVERFADK